VQSEAEQSICFKTNLWALRSEPSR